MDKPVNPSYEPMDGDWCLLDLSYGITEDATKTAHALGMDFYAFMNLALKAKLALLRGDQALQGALDEVRWKTLLKLQTEAHGNATSLSFKPFLSQ